MDKSLEEEEQENPELEGNPESDEKKEPEEKSEPEESKEPEEKPEPEEKTESEGNPELEMQSEINPEFEGLGPSDEPVQIVTTFSTPEGDISVLHDITLGDLLVLTVLTAFLIFYVLNQLIRRF